MWEIRKFLVLYLSFTALSIQNGAMAQINGSEPDLNLSACITTKSEENFFQELYSSFESIKTLISNNLKYDFSAHASTVRFIYYTNNSQTYITTNNASAVIDTTKGTKIIVHGWQSNTTMTPIIALINAYLSEPEGYTVIAMDWSEIAAQNYFNGCLAAIPKLGKLLADFVTGIGINVVDTDILGHSCGVHMAGHAGMNIQKTTGSKLKRIVALDAAKPGYSPQTIFRPLKKTDASYVTAFFSNPGFYGIDKPFADSNVLFNGECQPQCVQNFNAIGSSVCSHFEAIFYWADSVVNPFAYSAAACSSSGFTNCNCNILVQVGDKVSTDTEGNFFSTNTLEEVYTPSG